MEPLIRLGRCLSDPQVIRILAILAERNASPMQLRRELGMTTSALDARLRKLREANLIDQVGSPRSAQITLRARFAPVIYSILAEYADTLDWDYELTSLRARHDEDAKIG